MLRPTVTPLTPAIGAVIGNVDLSQKLDDELIADIRAALLKHKVVFFEDQHINAVQQVLDAGAVPFLHFPQADPLAAIEFYRSNVLPKLH